MWWRKVKGGEIIRAFKTQPTDPWIEYGNNSISDIDFARDGSLVAAGTNDGLVYVWSTVDGKSQVFETTCENGYWVYYVSLSYDALYLALQKRECEIEVIHLQDKTSRILSLGSEYDTNPFVFSPIMPWLAVYAENGMDVFSYPESHPKG